METTLLQQMQQLSVPCVAQPRGLAIITQQIETAYPRAHLLLMQGGKSTLRLALAATKMCGSITRSLASLRSRRSDVQVFDAGVTSKNLPYIVTFTMCKKHY